MTYGTFRFVIFISCAFMLKIRASTDIEMPFVAAFLYKDKFPPATVASGVVLTEKHILTAAYPVAIMAVSACCVIVGYSNLTYVTVDVMHNGKCILYKRVYMDLNWTPIKSALNLAIVLLNENIRFTWDVSTGRIPYPPDVNEFQYNKTCVIAEWVYRDAINAPGFPLTKVSTHLEFRQVTLRISGVNDSYDYVSPLDGGAFHVCTSHIGLPVVCDCNVIGILASDDFKGDVGCIKVTSFSYTSLLRNRSNNFLSDIVPS